MNSMTLYVGAKGKFLLRRPDGSLQRLGLRLRRGKLHVYDTKAHAWVEVTEPIKYGTKTVKVEVYD